MKHWPQAHGRATGAKTFEQVAEQAWDLAQYVTHRSTRGAKIGWPLNKGLRSLMQPLAGDAQGLGKGLAPPRIPFETQQPERPIHTALLGDKTRFTKILGEFLFPRPDDTLRRNQRGLEIGVLEAQSAVFAAQRSTIWRHRRPFLAAPGCVAWRIER
jgi:hypothetical protein